MLLTYRQFSRVLNDKKVGTCHQLPTIQKGSELQFLLLLDLLLVSVRLDAVVLEANRKLPNDEVPAVALRALLVFLAFRW